MGAMSIWHWVILGVVVLLLFGKGRFSGMMGDVAKGIKEFKKGMAEDDDASSQSTTNVPPRIDSNPQQPGQQTIEGQSSTSQDKLN